jgi:outer membrane beta-barrel protein
MLWKLFSAVIFCAGSALAAEIVELPKEELAQESVLPVFDNPTSVKNRNVVTQGHFEIGGFYGMALTEPIANVSKLGVSMYYHTSEDHAFGVFYTKNSTGQSDYAKQLFDQYQLDFSRAPAPNYTLMGDYNLKMFYGKLSMTKKTVLNVSLFASGAIGMVSYVNKSYPAVAMGVGQKFYLSNQFALRFDLRLYAHQAPIPFLEGNPGIREGTAKPDYSSFQERMTYTTNLDLGVSYLF